ncbi:MAG: low molecular weight phosphatase family protein [Gordonia polyisoprenivorans]|nr:low molecular weight phosphatase family protein [Gordonia polyisoprenivorans]
MSFRVLFVCTGNICRSPMAERLFRARLEELGGAAIESSSSGTRAVVGHEMDSAATLVLSELGGDPDGHQATQLEVDALRDADLVLTADTEQRSYATRSLPSAMRRIFTVREFARLGEGVATDVGPPRPGPAGNRYRRRVAEVAARRGTGAPVSPGSDDIGDPFGAPLAEMRACGAVINESVDILCHIFGVGPG